jgi:hypothetical protein
MCQGKLQPRHYGISWGQKNPYNPRMIDGDSVTKHLNAFNIVVSQLLYVYIKISDEDKCIGLLSSFLEL